MIAAMSLSVSTSRMTREGVVEHLLPELEIARRHLAALL
jgi:IclR family pca regulon transcriptional regulator